MTDAKGIVRAFVAGREGRQTILFADGGHAITTPGQDLVRIGLMADVPNQFVVRRVEDVMKGDGQVDRAESRREMPAGLAYAVQQEFPQLFRQLGQLIFRKRANVIRISDAVEQ